MESTSGRALVRDDGIALTIEIPMEKNGFVMVFLGIWLVGWAVGESFAASALSEPELPAEARMFLMVWLAGWTLGGFAALGAFAWMLAGREVLRVEAGVLTLTRQVGPVRWTRTYRKAECKNFRYQAPLASNGATTMRAASPAVAFDYGLKTVKFGFGLDEAEARHLSSLLER